MKIATPPLLRRPIDCDMAIEPSGAKQGRIEHVGPVRRGQHDHRFIRAEAVHFAQNLIERLLALVVPASQAGAAVPADGVDLVDEQDRRGSVFGRLEHIADPAGPDADEHLDEFGAADREKRHPRLAGHSPCEQSLAGPRRTHQQNALRHSAAEALELLGILQELDDLFEIVLDSFQAGNISERDRPAGRFIAFGRALAEAGEDAAPQELIAGPPH